MFSNQSHKSKKVNIFSIELPSIKRRKKGTYFSNANIPKENMQISILAQVSLFYYITQEFIKHVWIHRPERWLKLEC